jgi:hypothetical protein
MKYLFLILLFAFSCKSKQVVQPPLPKQDSAQVNNNLPSTLDTEAIINQVIEGIKDGSILIDSCGYMPIDGTIILPPPSTPRMEKIKGRNERKLTRINRRYDLKESKVEARKIIDSIRIITKTIYDTVRVRSEENVKVEKIESKQAIKETRIEQSWKKWAIVGFFIFILLLIVILIILKRLRIL